MNIVTYKILKEGRKIKLVFGAGGTGGHLFPALAVARGVKKRFPGAKILFLGSARGLERDVVPARGFTFKSLPIRGFRRGVFWGNLGLLYTVVLSLFRSMFLLKRFRPQAVMGTGGYVSGPVLLAALLLRFPTLIQEQNFFPGWVTRIMARWVDQVHLSYAETKKFLKIKGEVFLSGNPTREGIGDLNKEEAIKGMGLRPDMKTVLIFGGSQGARNINETVLLFVEELLGRANLIWLTGPAFWPQAHQKVSQLKPRPRGKAVIKEFWDRMDMAYGVADLVVCRAGASTVSELCRSGLGAILIPFPYSAAGHQEYNARMLAKAGAGVIVYDRELGREKPRTLIFELLEDEDRLRNMGNCSRRLAVPDAAERIVHGLHKLLERKSKG
ncbi:undecaprenyldiphospho-muramoylpentapeptide beta-N-acetylglucosaminyltransferase [candidate division KSB1 bacterium]|nr:undecaprenyldiphospho-muramoylpentapeptide beta-N-acetylglucosaminyltransferase [candidate division KSB1 bacterium]